MDETRSILERRYMLETLRTRLTQLQESYASLLRTHTPSGQPKSWPDYLEQFNILTARYGTSIAEMQRVARQLQHHIVLPLKPLVDPSSVGIPLDPNAPTDTPLLDVNFIPNVLLRTRLLPEIEKDENKRHALAHEQDSEIINKFFNENKDTLGNKDGKDSFLFEQNKINQDLQQRIQSDLEMEIENHETVIEFAQDIFADIEDLKKDMKKWDPAEQQSKIIDFRRREQDEVSEVELACVALYSGPLYLQKEKRSRWNLPHVRRNTISWRSQLAQAKEKEYKAKQMKNTTIT